AVFAEQPHQEVNIEFRRVEILLHRLDVALFPMLDDVVEEIDRPADAAFEEREFQAGEPPRHAAEDQRAAKELGAGGEIAEMVEDVIGRAGAEADAAARGMA